jgi:hypothetical protein
MMFRKICELTKDRPHLDGNAIDYLRFIGFVFDEYAELERVVTSE